MTVISPSLTAAITRLTGFTTDPRRSQLMADRIAPVLASHGLQDPEELALRLRPGVADAALAAALVDAVVINETLFFRDRALFDALRTVLLPTLIDARRERRRLRFWSAACSTGQEPYSLAMLLDEQSRALAGWTLDVVGTDISRTALAAARAGVYSHFEVQRGLSTHQLLRHFRRLGTGWEISEALREAVTFSERNLLADFRGLGQFDLVCCRNVLMYMDPKRRNEILERIADILAPDGYLVLGAAETIVGLTEAFVALPGQSSIFVKRTM